MNPRIRIGNGSGAYVDIDGAKGDDLASVWVIARHAWDLVTDEGEDEPEPTEPAQPIAGKLSSLKIKFEPTTMRDLGFGFRQADAA